MKAQELDALSGLLDCQILDHDGLMVGKVDDLELEVRADGRLVVTALLLGAGALGPRIGGGSGSVITRSWARLSGRSPADVYRIPFDEVASVDSAVHLGVSLRALDCGESEEWVRSRIIQALPGSGKDP